MFCRWCQLLDLLATMLRLLIRTRWQICLHGATTSTFFSVLHRSIEELMIDEWKSKPTHLPVCIDNATVNVCWCETVYILGPPLSQKGTIETFIFSQEQWVIILTRGILVWSVSITAQHHDFPQTVDIRCTQASSLKSEANAKMTSDLLRTGFSIFNQEICFQKSHTLTRIKS